MPLKCDIRRQTEFGNDPINNYNRSVFSLRYLECNSQAYSITAANN